jgi:predicted nucleic acid-binding Zn ribbon protein
MQELKNAITALLKKNNLEKGVNQNNALLIWASTVGKKIAQNTNPDKVEHGVLTIKVESPTWRQELVFEKQKILKKLNKKLGKNTIREIRFI